MYWQVTGQPAWGMTRMIGLFSIDSAGKRRRFVKLSSHQSAGSCRSDGGSSSTYSCRITPRIVVAGLKLRRNKKLGEERVKLEQFMAIETEGALIATPRCHPKEGNSPSRASRQTLNGKIDNSSGTAAGNGPLLVPLSGAGYSLST
jgi:hypothetical protein